MLSLKRSLIYLGTYLLVVVGGTTLAMLLALMVGYLPFGDRPGPGWYGTFSMFSLSSVRLLFGWVLFALPYLVPGGLFLSFPEYA